MLPDTFLLNPVHEKLEQLKQALFTNENREIIPIENLNFFESFYSYCKDRLNLTIPLLVQESELNSLSSEIEGGTAQINVYLGNKSTGHLNNAVNNFNSALNRIKNFPFPLSKDDFSFSNQIASFQNVLQSAYQTLNTFSENISQKLTDAENELGAKEAKIQELTQKLLEKETEIQNILVKYNAEFDAIKTSANTSVENDRNSFNTKIEEDRKVFTGLFKDDKEKYEIEFNDLVATLNESTTATIKKLNSKLEEAKKLVNVVGDIGVTGNYQNIANENRYSANLWRGIAVGFMVIMTGLLIWSIIELSYGEFNLYKSIVRIVAAAVLTYPAIYAARESSKHRKLETKNRNLELELAAIGPFIEMLPEAKKQLLKEELAKKYFANNNIEVDVKEEEDVSIGGLEKILKALLPLIKSK